MIHQRNLPIISGLFTSLLLILLVLTLAACDSSGSAGNEGFIHIEEGAAETQIAQTQTARPSPAATRGPSPTPTPTSAPYHIPTLDPALDPDTVITRVGNQAITLEDYQKQVRFERWYRLYQLTGLVERQGAARILDLRQPENAPIASLFATLADSDQFGQQVQRIMVIDALALQEALRRGIDVDPFQFDAILAQYLTLQVGEGGQLPPEFDARYADFLASMSVYTGMTEEEFRRIVRARTLYAQLEFIISNQPAALESAQNAVPGVEVQDTVLATEDLAQSVVARLEAGESLRDIASSFGIVTGDSPEWRTVRADDQTLPEAVVDALFNAEPGQIVGPLATPRGWYVAVVGAPVADIPSPAEISALKRRYFLDWVESLMDDPAYVQDLGGWRDRIPQEPLPQDVSPLLRDENVILPEE